MDNPEKFFVVALYKFVDLPHYEALREPLIEECQRLHIKGTLLLAREGINGTVTGPKDSIPLLIKYLSEQGIGKIDYKLAEVDANSDTFYRLKIKLKKEIVTIGVPSIDPNRAVGEYVSPQEWNDLISDPSVLVIDTRNDYEVEIGSFNGAVNPDLKTFREFPDYVKSQLDTNKHKRIAMFCTGGIRCEKASSYLLQEGFNEVYHLQGGILNYLKEIPESESLWSGECFVFDNRVTVDHQLTPGQFDQCHGCRRPITEEDKQSPHYQLGVACPKCFDKTTDERKAAFAERQKQIQLAKQKNTKHIGRVLERDKKPANTASGS